MTAAGHRHWVDRPRERDGKDPFRLPLRRPDLAGERLSALLDCGGLVSGSGREWGPAVDTTPETLATRSGPGATTDTALGFIDASRRRAWPPRRVAVG